MLSNGTGVIDERDQGPEDSDGLADCPQAFSGLFLFKSFYGTVDI